MTTESKTFTPNQISHQAQEAIQLLFAALLATTLISAMTGALIANSAVAWHAAGTIGGIAIAFELSIYGLWKRTNDLGISLCLALISLWLPVITQMNWLYGIPSTLVLIGCFSFYKHYRFNQAQASLAAVMGAAGAITVSSIHKVNEFDMSSWLYEGRGYIDTFFHSSIAAMIKNYGINSTGVHGLTDSGYYGFSHAIIASISKLSGESILQTYGVAPTILFIPLVLSGIGWISLNLKDLSPKELAISWVSSGILISLTPKLLQPWRFNDLLGSESHALACAIFLSTLPILWDTKTNRLIILLKLLLASLILASTKSTAAILLASATASLFTYRQKQNQKWAFLAMLTVLIGFASKTFSIASSNSSVYSLRLFGFIRGLGGEHSSHGGMYIGEAMKSLAVNRSIPSLEIIAWTIYALASFFLMHYLLCWIALWKLGTDDDFNQPARKQLTKIICLLTATSFLVFLLFDLLGGEAYLSHLAALAAVATLATGITRSLIKLQNSNKINKVAISTMATLLLLSGLYSNLKPQKVYELSKGDIKWIQNLEELRYYTPNYTIFRLDSNSANSLPYSDPNHAYCKQLPFVFSAISERPWLKTMEVNSKCDYAWYGYDNLGVIHEGKPSKEAIIPNGFNIKSWPEENSNTPEPEP